MFQSERTDQLIRRRVSKGNTEAESRELLDQLLRTRGAGTLASALHYCDFATADAAEAFAAEFLANAEIYTVTGTREGHAGRVEIVDGRYPFRAACSCGEGFRGYVAKHAAKGVLEAHLNGEG